MPAPNIAKVIVKHTCQGQDILNMFHFSKPTAINQSDLDGLASDVSNLWIANIMPLVSNQLVLTEVDAVDLTTQSGPESQFIVNPTVPGTLTSPMLPSNVALVLTKRTAKRGRSYRGRTYIAGATQAEESGPLEIGTATLSSFLTAITTVLTDSTLAPFVAGVLSYFLNGVPRSTGVLEPITAVSANTQWDSQRRRLFGRGA